MTCVVVTGTGLFTALGASVSECFERVCNAQTASQTVERFVAEGLSTPLGAPIDRGSLDGDEPAVTQFIVRACQEALERAGIDGPLGDTPFLVANTIGSPQACERPGGWDNAQPDVPEMFERYGQAALVARAAQRLGARGLVDVIGNTCAAGNYAIGLGATLIREGQAERVVVGGSEELSVLPFTAFSQLRAIGAPCRPFDEARDGMLFGEGAAILVLESLDSAQARGAAILCEVAAVAYSNDAYHLVAPDPEGAGLERALRGALESAGLSGVDYVNAHGTGTPLNDVAEAQTLNRVLGSQPAVSSTKGATGHCMGGASAVEAVLTIESMVQGRTLPNVAMDT
ncbi:MAG: beta-ketoacyl-[acyl-carrier-protein] synthase family protein, partial [Myxococcota bacterium]